MTDARALAGHLRLHPGRRDGPAISGGRPDWLARLAPGRDADTLPALLGALFSLCADAHRDCARAALRAARGQTESAAEAAVAAQALRLGTAREHLLRLGHELPRRLGMNADAGAAWLRSSPPWRDDLDPIARLAALPAWLQRHLLGSSPADWLHRHTAAPCDRLEAVAHWAQEQAGRPEVDPGSPVHALAALAPLARSLATPGPAALRPGTTDWAALARAMDADAGFCRLPHRPGDATPAGVPDTGPWCREADAPAEAAQAGASAWGRLGARLVELVRLAGPDGARRLQRGALALGPGDGLAWCEMARGLLLHRVRLEADGRRVAAWQVLAPTEWNAHPRGTLAQALAALPDTGPRSEAARLLALAFDPCVDVEVICDA